MMTLLFGLLIGLLLTYILTPITIRLAHKFGFVDDPSTHNHPAIVHTGIIPRAGGLPIFLGICATYLFLLHGITKQAIGILLGAFLLVIIGLLDDRFDISPYIRFVINIIVALIVVGFGIGIGFITNPIGGILHLNQFVYTFTLFGESHSIIVLADLLAVLWIVWMMNAINWSSGVDGQLSGIIVIAAAVLGMVGWRFAQTDASQWPVVFLALAVVAAYAGFLPWSFFPQKIMPGYSGAAMGGYFLAVLAILSGAKLATAIIVLGVPMADGIFAIIRRLSRKQSPFRGDREHFHHYLLKLGYSKRSIALFYWVTCAMLGLVALQLNSKGKLFTVILILVLFGGITYWLRYFTTYSKQQDPDSG